MISYQWTKAYISYRGNFGLYYFSPPPPPPPRSDFYKKTFTSYILFYLLKVSCYYIIIVDTKTNKKQKIHSYDKDASDIDGKACKKKKKYRSFGPKSKPTIFKLSILSCPSVACCLGSNMLRKDNLKCLRNSYRKKGNRIT